jgi:hypothetical protein
LESDDDFAKEEFIHRYTIDLISEYKDLNEPNLVLHWALGRKSATEWSKPDDSFLPKNSIKMPDNIAV